MIVPRLLQVRDWATWDKVSLRLDTPGVSTIRGRNLDDVDNENGVGKSALMNAMYALNHGQHQLAQRKRSVGKLVSDNTRIREVIDVGSRRVVADMRGKDLQVSIDGHRIEAHKKGDERVELLSALGMPTELWSSTVHINGVAANPLVRGSSAARCQFLEKAFDLDRHAPLHQRVGDIMSAMRQSAEELNRCKAELEGFGAEIDLNRERARVEILRARRLKLRSFLSAAERMLGLVESLPDCPEESVASLEKSVSSLEQRISDASKQAAAYALWEDAARRRHKLKLQISELCKLQTDVPMSSDTDGQIEKLESYVDKWEGRLESIEAVREWLHYASLIAKDHGIVYDNLHQLHALSQGWIRNWSDGQTQCSVCGGKLKREVNGKYLNRLKVSLGKFDEPFDPDKAPDIARLSIKIHRLKSAQAMQHKQKEIAANISRLRVELNLIELPERLQSGGIDVDSLTARLSQLRSSLSAARQWEKAGKASQFTAETLKSRIAKAHTAEEQMSEKIATIEATLVRAEEQQTSRKVLIDRIDKLEEQLVLRPIYRALQMAYSPNGVRLWLLQELLEALVSGLNANSHDTRDTRTYGYKLSRNRDLTLTASTPRGTFDLYLLSGAESSLFVLKFLTVILPMLPDSRRCSMLILDEVDANCSPRSRSLIADVYVPRLAEIVDSIFMLTPFPKSDMQISGSHELLVTKKNFVSTLEVLS